MKRNFLHWRHTPIYLLHWCLFDAKKRIQSFTVGPLVEWRELLRMYSQIWKRGKSLSLWMNNSEWYRRIRQDRVHWERLWLLKDDVFRLLTLRDSGNASWWLDVHKQCCRVSQGPTEFIKDLSFCSRSWASLLQGNLFGGAVWKVLARRVSNLIQRSGYFCSSKIKDKKDVLRLR